MLAVRPSPARRRSAFTLLELLLALALLVALAAISWPALEAPLSAQRLRAAADQLRADWVNTRLAAMRSGEPYIFRYEPGTSHYVLEPYQLGAISAQGAGASGQVGSFGASAAPVTGNTLAAPAMPRSRLLPDEATFAAGQTAGDARATAMYSQQGWAQPASSGAAATSGTSTILFYPDGTTSSASVVLAGEHGNHIELRLRGLTGIVTTGEVFRAADALSPLASEARLP